MHLLSPKIYEDTYQWYMGVVYNDAWLPLQNSQIYALIKISLETRLFAFKTIVIDLFSTERLQWLPLHSHGFTSSSRFVQVWLQNHGWFPDVAMYNNCALWKKTDVRVWTVLDLAFGYWLRRSLITKKHPFMWATKQNLTQDLLTSPRFYDIWQESWLLLNDFTQMTTTSKVNISDQLTRWLRVSNTHAVTQERKV